MVVALQLYDGPAFDPSTLDNQKIEKLVEHYKDNWQYEAIHKLRYGQRSFVLGKEPEYFHNAFRQAFGSTWADSISPLDFVMGDINEILKGLLDQSLPVNWDATEPSAMLKVAVHSQQSGVSFGCRIEPKLLIQRKSKTRFTLDGTEEDEFEAGSQDLEIKCNEKFQLRIKSELLQISGVPNDWTCMVIEYREQALVSADQGHEVQARVMNEPKSEYGDFVLRNSSKDWLVGSQIPGLSGFVNAGVKVRQWPE
ncbi:MAG: hypothetical protein AAF903_07720 [Pseudomonadota bacterium]